MTNIRLYPSSLAGEIVIPPSKSISHRAIICASLTSGISKIENIDFSDDIMSTIGAMKKLGAEITAKGDCLYIQGLMTNRIKGTLFDHKLEKCTTNDHFNDCSNSNDVLYKNNIETVDCSESGSTLRFIVPIFSALAQPTRYIGRGNLGKRPLSIYYNIFNEQHIRYKYKKDELDLTVIDKLKPGDFYVEGNVSSQFISGLLFALPILSADSKIIITTEFESKPYLDLTLSVLKVFGIDIVNNDYREFIIKGKQQYKCCNYTVEGDYSQAAYFLCANALGADISIKGLKKDSLQGDKEIISILERMVTSAEINEGKIYNHTKQIEEIKIDASQCPDIIPIVSLVAALRKGETKILNAHRLKIKECDRLEATRLELLKLGANIKSTEDSLVINGVDELRGGVDVWSHNDHRIAMMLSIASCFCKEAIILLDSECTSKSYPNFYKDFAELGGKLYEWNMGK